MAVKIKNFMKREAVLCISFLAAVISMFFVPPDAAYLGYTDWRTLALLYCLMIVVAGLRRAETFTVMAHALCERAADTRLLTIVLTALCFFASMLITNDVSLLTFVPFTVTVLALAGKEKLLIRIVVLQTAAANLGSMLTPVGNPQNIYIQSHYNLGTAEFLRVTGPVWLLSLVLLGLLCLTVKREPLTVCLGRRPDLHTKELGLYLTLFAVCLLTVLRILSWPVMLAIVGVVLLIADRKALKEADFCLLLTFVFFFVFSGNLARIDAVSSFLHRALDGHEYGLGLAVSQVISNVPATLLLSGFTDRARELLLGVNVGGLGTPIASLASLISLKLYLRTDGARAGRYLAEFTLINVLLLALLSAASVLLLR